MDGFKRNGKYVLGLRQVMRFGGLKPQYDCGSGLRAPEINSLRRELSGRRREQDAGTEGAVCLHPAACVCFTDPVSDFDCRSTLRILLQSNNFPEKIDVAKMLQA